VKVLMFFAMLAYVTSGVILARAYYEQKMLYLHVQVKKWLNKQQEKDLSLRHRMLGKRWLRQRFYYRIQTTVAVVLWPLFIIPIARLQNKDRARQLELQDLEADLAYWRVLAKDPLHTAFAQSIIEDKEQELEEKRLQVNNPGKADA
jgi:hypothetical protein